jgi:hypothetical protein
MNVYVLEVGSVSPDSEEQQRSELYFRVVIQPAKHFRKECFFKTTFKEA